MQVQKLKLFSEKIRTFACSHKSTMIIAQNYKIYWFGTNSIIQNINYPIEVDLQKTIKGIPKDKSFLPIKFQPTWNRSFISMGVIFADLRNLKNVTQKVQYNIVDQILSKWEENNIE